MHPSVTELRQEFDNNSAFTNGIGRATPSWHFCDNQQDADECARLVAIGRKRATAPSLWGLRHAGESLPGVGDLHIITDWAGIAQCIIRIIGVEILPFNEVNEEHAHTEGEGDGSLSWWRQVHWAYYHRELEGSGYQPKPDMPIVFQRFECVFCALTEGATIDDPVKAVIVDDETVVIR